MNTSQQDALRRGVSRTFESERNYSSSGKRDLSRMTLKHKSSAKGGRKSHSTVTIKDGQHSASAYKKKIESNAKMENAERRRMRKEREELHNARDDHRQHRDHTARDFFCGDLSDREAGALLPWGDGVSPGSQSQCAPVTAGSLSSTVTPKLVAPLLPLDTKLIELLLCLTPTMEQRGEMLRVVKDVQHSLRRIGLTVEIYGSLGTGLLIPTSDVDCVMVALPENEASHHSGCRTPPVLSNMMSFLSKGIPLSRSERTRCLGSGVRVVANTIRNAQQFNRILAIAHAKVPIVKCVHRESGLKVDLSFERDGCTTSSFLCTEFCKPGNELARALTVLVKAFIAHNGLDDPSVGGLGSFPTALMVLWYVQHEVAQRYPSELQGSVGVLFTGFLKYYGMDFDFARTAIDYVRGCTFTKPPMRELFIVNPVKPGTNCAKAATRFASHVIPQFQEAARTLCNLLEMHTEEARIEVALDRFFGNCVKETRDWHLVRRAANAFPRTSQHLWEVESNMYIGGVIDR